MATPPPEMPDKSTLEKMYLNGLIRNINSILAGVYGQRETNRARGERSDEVLMHLLRHESLSSVASRLASLESRGRKQGNASLHDLALAHVLLSSIQLLTSDKNGPRSASMLASSMLLGEIVAELRVAYGILAQAFPGRLLSELSNSELAKGLGSQLGRIEHDITSAIKSEGRATHLVDLKQHLTARNLLQIFSLIIDEGLDDRPFEAFLGVATD